MRSTSAGPTDGLFLVNSLLQSYTSIHAPNPRNCPGLPGTKAASVRSVGAGISDVVGAAGGRGGATAACTGLRVVVGAGAVVDGGGGGSVVSVVVVVANVDV